MTRLVTGPVWSRLSIDAVSYILRHLSHWYPSVLHPHLNWPRLRWVKRGKATTASKAKRGDLCRAHGQRLCYQEWFGVLPVGEYPASYLFHIFGVWMITLCSSWEKLRRVIWVWILGAPGGLPGTAAAYPEPQPYQDPSARHSATLLTRSIPLSVFLPQSPWLGLLFSLYPFPDLCHPPNRLWCLNRSQNVIGTMAHLHFWWLILNVFMKYFHCWPVSSDMLAVAEGYNTFNIVFMAIGDSRASECFSVCLTQCLTTSM